VQRTAKLEDGGMAVGPPKAKHANRTLHLPGDAVELMAWQHGQLGKPGKGLCFPTGNGTMANHSNLSRSLQAWSVRAGVTPIRVHDLRHTYASMRISQGVDPVTLSRELGHHSPAFTMSRYAHFFEAVQVRQPLSLLELAGAGNAVEKAEDEASKVISKVNPGFPVGKN
jgi:integrase